MPFTHLTVWSKLQLANHSPWSWYFTLHTACLCSWKVATHFCLAKLQILTVLSPDPEARLVPSGWKLTPATQSLCPSPHMMRSPLGRCHIFQVLSSLAVTSRGLEGWITRLATDSKWPYMSTAAAITAGHNVNNLQGQTFALALNLCKHLKGHYKVALPDPPIVHNHA